MESTEVKKTTVIKKTNAKSLRVRPETKKRVLSELAKVNKKTLGRKVRVDQLLNVLLGLLNPEYIQQLQEDSLSNSDRIEMKYREYVKHNGPVSKDEFLGLLLPSKDTKSAVSNEVFQKEK